MDEELIMKRTRRKRHKEKEEEVGGGLGRGKDKRKKERMEGWEGRWERGSRNTEKMKEA